MLLTKQCSLSLFTKPCDRVATMYNDGWVANLSHEEVAHLLQQNNETWWRAEVSAVGPHQTHSVHQGADLTSDLRKLYVFHVFKQMLEWLQVDADVPRLFQS